MVTGKQIGGYEILEELGRGAMGVVFKARQVSMDRIVAIKFLPKRLAADERIVARFLREARAAGQLAHPNIVSVHELGIAEGLHFIAMEYVDGNSIQKKLKDKGPFTEKETLEIGAQIAEALKLAHTKGVLHRDIKPDNFLIDSMGRVRLADLGLASIESSRNARDGSLTQDGTTLGTPHYMSPEQCSGTQVDGRSDLYSLGASMFVMSCGRTPYEGTTAAAVMVKVLTEGPQSLKKFRPELSPGFVALIEKLMQKDASKRFQNAQAVAEAIQQCKAGAYKPPVPAKPAAPAKNATVSLDKTPARPIKPTESKLMPLMVGAAAAIGLIVLLAALKGPGPSAINREARAVAQPSTTVNTNTSIEPSSTRAVAVKQPDDSKAAENDIDRHPVQLAQIRTITNEFERGKIKTGEALRRLTEFRVTHESLLKTAPNLRTHADRLYRLLRPKLMVVAEDWKKLEPQIEADLQAARSAEASAKLDLKAAKIAEALTKLCDFHATNEGTDEGDKALARIDALCSGMLLNAERLGATNPKDALAALSSVTAKLPAKQDQALKAAIADHARRAKLNDELSEVYEAAWRRAIYFDPLHKTKFEFVEAANVCRERADRMKDDGNRKDAQALAELFKSAGKIFLSLRAQLNARPVELPSLANFNNVKVTQWDDKGLTFVTAQINQAQPFTWESASSPEIVLQLTKELRRADLDKPAGQWDFGVLAFALGNKVEASKALRDATAKEDSPYRTPAAAALRLLKTFEPPPTPIITKVEKQEPPAPLLYTVSTGDDEARQLFKDFQDAQKGGDKAKLKNLRDELDGRYSATEFVKTHRKEIDDAIAAAGLPAVDPAKAPDPAKPAAKADAMSFEEKEARELLKKNGWADIAGVWVWDKTNAAFRVDGLAEVSHPALESDVSVQFKLIEPASKLRVLARVEKSAVADRFASFGAQAGLGFGADINQDNAFIYGDYIPRKGSVRDPTKYGLVRLEPGRPYHIVDLSVHKKISVTVDGKENNTAGDARATGDTRVIVQGPALLVPRISNTK